MFQPKDSKLTLCALCLALATYSCGLAAADVSQQQPAQLKPQQQQQQQQRLQKAPHKQSQLKAEANSENSRDYLGALGSLLRQQQIDSDSSNKIDDDFKRAQDLKRQEKHKFELKRRLHKLVDELLDAQAAEQMASAAGSGSLSMRKVAPEEVVATRRAKKWSDGGAAAAEDGQKIVIIVKPEQQSLKAGPEEGASSGQMFEQNSLESLLGQRLQQQQQQQQMPASQLRRPSSGAAEHERRVLDDSFGIRRESLFTTNNHLGLKGVPKFGSEEEY